MVLDGEISGAGAPELVKLFVEVTKSNAQGFVPKDTTIQLKRLVGGITTAEMTCGKSIASISFAAADWSQTLAAKNVTYVGEEQIGSASIYVRSPQQYPYRDFVSLIARACD